jgi:hypothetical protein
METKPIPTGKERLELLVAKIRAEIEAEKRVPQS